MFLARLFNKEIIPFIVSLALFMEAVDTTIINTAIPAMARSLAVNPVDLKIALISYLLSLAIFIPISGWVGDKFGIKRAFIASLILFTLSSAWCGFAHNIYELAFSRTLQGLGGSLALPLGRLIILRRFGRHELLNVMSRVIMVAALGLMLGPVLGGFITHYFSWQWIFWVNIPIGILTAIMAAKWLVDTPPIPVAPLDKLGFVLFGTGLAGLTFGLSAFSETTIKEWVAVLVLVFAVIMLLAYLWHSRKQLHPIVKTELFSYRTFRVSALANLFARLGFGGVPFLLPLLLQVGIGYPAQISGLLLAPSALGVLIVKPFSLFFLRLFGYKRLLIVNTLLVGLSLWSFTQVNINTGMTHIACLTFIYGFLISLQYSGMNSLAYADMTTENFGAATSIMSTLQQLAQSFGVAVSALLIRLFTPSTTHEFSLTPSVFHQTFFAMGLFTFLSVFIFIKLSRDDGHQLILKNVPASE